MANGFFLGGVAEGMEVAEKQRLARETLATETGLREKQLGLEGQRVGLAERAQKLQENNAARAVSNEDVTRATTQISDLMTSAAETAKAALAAGRDPATIGKAIAPLVEQAKRLAPFAKMDPTAIDARGQALLHAPTQAEGTTATANTAAAKAEGETVGTARGQVKAAKELEAAGVTPSPFKDPKDRVSAENALRDDYLKQSSNFITMRDAKSRLDSLEKTGAGDMALVFQYMKILDPGSTVREGEYATAANSGGVPSAVQGLYNKVVGGGVIGDQTRKEIISQANKFYDKAGVQHDKLTSQFASTAKRQGLNVDNVVYDLKPGEAVAAAGTTPGGIGYRVKK